MYVCLEQGGWGSTRPAPYPRRPASSRALDPLGGTDWRDAADHIDKATKEIKQDEDKVVYESLEEIGEDLPDHSPRFVLLSYPLTLVRTPLTTLSVPKHLHALCKFGAPFRFSDRHWRHVLLRCMLPSDPPCTSPSKPPTRPRGEATGPPNPTRSAIPQWLTSSDLTNSPLAASRSPTS